MIPLKTDRGSPADYELWVFADAVLVRDLDKGGRSVTSDIDNILAELAAAGHLTKDQRFYYRDSIGGYGEVVIRWWADNEVAGWWFRTGERVPQPERSVPDEVK